MPRDAIATAWLRVLPLPGPVWGEYPVRPARDASPSARAWRWRTPLAQCRAMARQSGPHARDWGGADAASRGEALRRLRGQLRRDGLVPSVIARALGIVSACAAETLGWTPREPQCLAAAALIDGRMAEMATGEGKTLAIGLAAAVAALAGMPVHVATANDYLAARDAQRLAPFYAALGLSVAALPPGGDEAARRAAYACDIVYTTARELAFDHLRDLQATGRLGDGERIAAQLSGQAVAAPTMRGLCVALLDEADSLLLDEAEVPLILSRAAPQAARRAFLWQALSLARGLREGDDFTLQRDERWAALTAHGESRLAALAAGLGGPWLRPRYRREAVQLALAALHAYRPRLHYVVRQGQIELLDEITGRVAVGRVWSRGLHTLVALKEGLSPPAETETVAQITFQRFFQRYWRLGGISGTLAEAAAELREVFGAAVVRVPLHRPCRRRELPVRRFDSEAARLDALAAQVVALQASGRPVLIGTDGVEESQRVSTRLDACGIAHRVLNALNDADEAAIVAEAGCAGRVTVATRMAGRGTDIALDAPALAAGGLHVLSCQDNPSRRLDRQLAGRAARHGDPGSCELWLVRRRASQVDADVADNPKVSIPFTHCASTTWLTNCWRHWTQSREERRRAAIRASLMQQDRLWERRLSFAGSAHWR